MIGGVYRRWRHTRHQADERRILLAMRGGGRNYGYNIALAAGMRPGSIYPVLARLEAAGLVRTGWDDSALRRRWYQLSEDGMGYAVMFTRHDR